MNKKASRRNVPASWIAKIVLGLLLLFEVSLICGVTEIKGSTIVKVAPWAYESFLRLVGEEPGAAHAMKRGETETDTGKIDPAVSNVVANVTPAELALPVETNVDKALPAVDSEPPVEAPATNTPPSSTEEEAVPVG